MAVKVSRSKTMMPCKSLGPVSDLERHLPQDWWRSLFNAVYLKTDGDVVENNANTAQDVDMLLNATTLDPGSRILDLCCGQGRHCMELARRGFRKVTGIDRSRYLVRLARKRAEKLNLNLTFREGDARKFRIPQNSFDAVAVFGNSFGYFEREEDDREVLERLRSVLKPGGWLFMDVTDGQWMRDHFSPRSWEWIDQNHFVCRERAMAKDGRRLVSREVITHVERGVIVDQFYAERLYSVEELKELLSSVGFEEIALVDTPLSHSDRQQDLGMMDHRIVLISRAPTPKGPAPAAGPLYPKVTVLMGDPSLPDIVKLEGKFNSEDLNTIKQLKDALKSLPGYNFQYWDSHHKIIDLIRSDRPDFVLNLCDEGFMNDAFKELHVPALLEMFDIPYSGGSPACLAMCYNKSFVRSVAQSLEIPVPLESYFSADDQSATLPANFPILLKPNFGDSSQGITKDAVITSQEGFIRYLEELRNNFPQRPLLVQEFLSGAEYSVSIVGNPGREVTVLPILEVDYSGLETSLPQILGYESKWDPQSPYWSQIKYKEASLSDDTLRIITDHSLLLFERLDCRDYARIDFRADSDGLIKLLEVNPNPGWCWDGKLNFMAGFAGLSYADLIRMIIEAAQDRYKIPKLQH